MSWYVEGLQLRCSVCQTVFAVTVRTQVPIGPNDEVPMRFNNVGCPRCEIKLVLVPDAPETPDETN